MTLNLSSEQLLNDGLPANLSIPGRFFFPDMIQLLRGDNQSRPVHYSYAQGAGEQARHMFVGDLSRKFTSQRALLEIQCGHQKRFTWLDTNTGCEIYFPDLIWLCEALADGYAGSDA